MKNDVVFLAWQKHRRSVTLCSCLGIRSMFLENSFHRLLKYPLFTWKTLLFLFKERPQVLIVQNPSIVLSCITLLIKPVLQFFLIIDAHNGGVIWNGSARWFFQPILNILHRYANITIVTNEPLSDIIIEHGGNPFILPDAIPDFRSNTTRVFNRGDTFIITFINTFSSDEPYKEVFAASKLLPNNTLVYITGNVEKAGGVSQFNCEGNVIFKGYIPETNYLDLLGKSDCIIDLTIRDNCLVCGAYEGLALGIPMVLSDSVVTRQLFNKGVAYCKADALSIMEAILDVMENHATYQKQLIVLRNELQAEWEILRKSLMKIIVDNCNTSTGKLKSTF